MLKHPSESGFSRRLMILLLNCMVLIGGSVCPAIGSKEPIKIIPYPTKPLPIYEESEEAKQECFILNQNRRDEWTDQEIYVDSQWKNQEKWIWNKLCLGEVADLEEYKDCSDEYCKTVETKGFLQTILLREPFKSALPEKVSIKNAIFSNEIDLSSTQIDKELHFQRVKFQNKVNFSNVKISNSLSFNESEFKQTLELKHALIQGSLFLTKVDFDLAREVIDYWLQEKNKDIVIINLRKIQVEGDLNLKDIQLKPLLRLYLLVNRNKQINNKEFGLKSLGLLAGKIGGSLEIKNSDFKSNLGEWCKSLVKAKVVEEIKPCGEVELIAVRISDAFKITSDINNGTQFNQLNLKNSQIKTFLMEVSGQEKVSTSSENSSLLTIFKNSKEIPKDIFHVVSQNINMQDANVNLFQVISRKKDKGNSKKDTKEKNNSCQLNLDGFLYQQANISAFNSIVICLKDQYARASDLKEYNQLLQPFEQAATMARKLGQYPIERELLYKRKKLDLKIARKSGPELFWERVILQISDWIYGFGYDRRRVILFFILFWIVGVGFCYREICRKQIESIKDNVKRRNEELKDEKVEDLKGNLGNGCAGPLEFEDILPYVDSIKRIVFQGKISSENTRESSIYVVFKEDFNKEKAFSNKTKISPNKDYFKISWEKRSLPYTDYKDIKRLSDTLDARVPDNTKVGFCKNLFLNSGLWLVYEKQKRNIPFWLILFLRWTVELKFYNLMRYALMRKELKYELYSLNENKYFPDGFSWSLARRRAINSFVYSFDILLPIIELDQELYNFIFQDSKGVTKLYFIFQKLMAAVIATILVPILFISGL